MLDTDHGCVTIWSLLMMARTETFIVEKYKNRTYLLSELGPSAVSATNKGENGKK